MYRREYIPRIKIGSIYDRAALKFARKVKKKSDSTPDGLLAVFTCAGDTLTFKHDCEEVAQYGDINGLHNAFVKAVNEYHKRVGDNAHFFVVANRGKIDKQNTYPVKYNSRKIKNVPRLGGIESFTIWRAK